jgi:hypothetical protein
MVDILILSLFCLKKITEADKQRDLSAGLAPPKPRLKVGKPIESDPTLFRNEVSLPYDSPEDSSAHKTFSAPSQDIGGFIQAFDDYDSILDLKPLRESKINNG